MSYSLLGNDKETSVQRFFNKPDGTSFNQIANETHVVTLAVVEDWINIATGRSQPGFPCQQPQKQDEAYAAYTYPGKNELSCSAVTQGKEILRHPVVEQLAMTGTRSGIRSHRLTSDGTTREQSPKSCLAGLSTTGWSEVRDHEAETVKCC